MHRSELSNRSVRIRTVVPVASLRSQWTLRSGAMTDKPSRSSWEKLYEKESRGRDLSRETVEKIRLRTVYDSEDAEGIDSGYPGIAPFTRGPYATMYAGRPWTIRQYAGFSTAEES